MNLYDLLRKREEDEFEGLDSSDVDRLYKKYDATLGKVPFEMEILRLELKKDLKQLKKCVDALTQDNEQFRNLTDKFQNKNHTKLETFEQRVLEFINDELSKVRRALTDKMNYFQQKYMFLDPSNSEKFIEMFETAEVTVDLIRKRDQQLKELFKITTEMNLKSELVDDDLKNIKKAYSDLVDDIKSNNQDLAKFIEDTKQSTEDNLTNKFKNDQLKLFNEVDNLRAELDLKENDFAKINSLVNGVEHNINSVKKKFAEYDEKIKHCTKEIDEFREITENLTIYLNTDITGKINGILRFLGKSELDGKI